MPKSKTNLHDKITQWLQVYCGADGGKHFQFTSKEYELFCKACGKVVNKMIDNFPK
jgi:hypothetical protein